MSTSDSTPKVRGSCLCGKIQYEMKGELKNNCLCFCNSCRKVTGSIGMANTWLPKEVSATPALDTQNANPVLLPG